jgi:acyl dehydratase
MQNRRFYEDLRVGEKKTTPRYTMTENEIVEFARKYDPQPMHIDKAAAAQGPFGGIIASGWHTAAVAMRLTADAAMLGNTGEVLGMGVENLTWPKPVRPGDILEAEIEIESMRESKSNPKYGVVKLATTVRNQRGETVYTFSPSCWVLRRPA